jgi:hypothetical protein
MKAVLIPVTGGVDIVDLADICECAATPDGGLDAQASVHAHRSASSPPCTTARPTRYAAAPQNSPSNDVDRA